MTMIGEIVAAFQDAGDVDGLIGLLDDPDVEVRARAAVALRKVGVRR